MKLAPYPLALALALSAACAAQVDAPSGSLRAPLVFPGPDHGVTAIAYTVVDAAGTCADAPIASATRPIEAEPLPIHLEGDAPGGDAHPFGDALFVLPPGDYRVCATPLLADGTASPDCAPTSGTATVLAEQTTEIVLIAQCEGDATGGLDVVVALNSPPHIDDLTLSPSKFSEDCAPVTLAVAASDPNGDALSYTWAVVSVPAGGSATIADLGAGSATFQATAPGAYGVTVTVDDGHTASASLTFPIHVSGTCASGPTSDCCTAHAEPGCDDSLCTADVCSVDPFCCEFAWDPTCADEALNLCPAQCGPTPPGGQCPAEEPTPNAPCTDEGLTCEFGQECCCGDCFPSFSCTCLSGTWACLFTDACLAPPCEP